MADSRGSKELPTPKKQRMGSLEAPLKRELRSDADRGARAALLPDDDAAPSGKDSPLRAPSVGASNDTADGPPWKRDTAVLGGEGAWALGRARGGVDFAQ